jgi:DNA mismatch repair protein MutS
MTPMLKQYEEMKRQHPGTLLFFRLGDFYELFFDDAVLGARELEITLTARHRERGQPVPMCGVPHHAAASHIARLIRKGYRVAVCEQTEEASKTKKLVRREVVRVITPGTAIDPQIVGTNESVYLAAMCGTGDRFAAAFLDLSTGEFHATQTSGPEAWAEIRATIESYAPRELLFPESLAPLVHEAYDAGRSKRSGTLKLVEQDKTIARITPKASDQNSIALAQQITLTPLDEFLWQPPDCAELLLKHFGVRTLESFGIEHHPQIIRAAGACLRYARETQRAGAEHITDLEYFETRDFLILDAVTIRNLELTTSQNPNLSRAASLLGIIDETVTGMGARLLQTWLLRPSLRRGEIEARHSAVEELFNSQILRDKIRARLKDVADLERLVGRVNMNTATPRDLSALRRSLDQVPEIKRSLSDANSSLLSILHEAMDDLSDVRSLIEAAIADNPPATLSEGGAIRDGFCAELDELRAISRDAKSVIAALEARERARSGISNLRVKFNNVFGYFIEVSKASAQRAPADYERRQTLANAERYTTPELKELESRVLGADARMLEIETNLFAELRTKVATETKRLQTTARALASLDVLTALAETAVRRRYVRPVIHDGDEVEIKAGRHPVIEALSDQLFVPNDLYMNNSTDRLLIITGPNMNGKSTVLRQTALIAILAQMGSFVPADAVRLPLFDRIWTRVGASDDLSRGRSTFMVEMTEAATILRGATPRSLILLDEIGRGTATFDGLSIAWAIAEYLHDSGRHAAKTLFATHYHELTELAEKLPGAQNYQMRVAEKEDGIVFLYRLERGRASKSYGIEVARLAGLPPEVTRRAREILQRLEQYELEVLNDDELKEASAETFKHQRHMRGNGEPSSPASLETAVRRAGVRRRAAQVSSQQISSQATLFDHAARNGFDKIQSTQESEITTSKPD